MAGIYRQRHPERNVFYRVMFRYFDEFVSEYESRFEKEYGYFRPIIKEIVDRYLDCGNPKCGFARIRCRGWAEMIRKVYEVDPMVCPQCSGRMKIISFLTDHVVVDRIIDHLKLTFVAERPPSSAPGLPGDSDGR